MDSYSSNSYDQFFHRSDDSKTHKLKSAYWTTKQVIIKKFKRKEDENVVASDSDLDSKLELLKSVQKTSRELMNILVRYQDTLFYLSQSESEMGRFLKRYSLEDKTQAGKIMSAAGKALSHSAQQRLLLRSPLDRVLQEVKTFRQRAISDTIGTLNRMEAARTEYRGALLWMKHVSEELDPDTFKQLEKFRRVQAQVKKTKANFDRLKIDSMQKIDLLSASRCNMLSHVLATYQNSLLTFLEKTSRTMVAVSDRFRGYQYYEFSVLKQLLPESKRLAGITDEAGEPGDDEDGDFDISEGGASARRSQDQQTGATEEELDRRLDEIFKADEVGGEGKLEDTVDLTDHSQRAFRFPASWEELIDGSQEDVPAEHKDLLIDLFGPNGVDNTSFGPFQTGVNAEAKPTKSSEFEGEWKSVFGQTQDTPMSKPTSGTTAEDPWNRIRTADSSTLPSFLWDHREKLEDATARSDQQRTDPAGPTSSGAGSSSVSGSTTRQQPTNLDAWMKLFSDLGQIGNPDSISKQDGQITDA